MSFVPLRSNRAYFMLPDVVSDTADEVDDDLPQNNMYYASHDIDLCAVEVCVGIGVLTCRSTFVVSSPSSLVSLGTRQSEKYLNSMWHSICDFDFRRRIRIWSSIALQLDWIIHECMLIYLHELNIKRQPNEFPFSHNRISKMSHCELSTAPHHHWIIHNVDWNATALTALANMNAV